MHVLVEPPQTKLALSQAHSNSMQMVVEETMGMANCSFASACSLSRQQGASVAGHSPTQQQHYLCDFMEIHPKGYQNISLKPTTGDTR